MQSDLTTTSAKFQVAKGAITAMFGFLKRHSRSVQVVEAAVHERMKLNLLNYTQTIFEQVKQRTMERQLNVDSDISSLGTALIQDIISMWSQITEHFDRGRRDV